MSDLGRLRPHTSTITLTLDKTTLDYTERLTGRITITSQEDLVVERVILEILVVEKMQWQGRTVASPLHRHPIVIGQAVTIERSRPYELPFAIDLPFYARPNPYVEIEVGFHEIAHVRDRKDIRRGASYGPTELTVRFPFVIECDAAFGGCGFTSPPTMELVKFCPACGKNQEEIWVHHFAQRQADWRPVPTRAPDDDAAATGTP